MTWLLSLFSGLWGKIAIGGAAFAAVAGGLFAVRQGGKDAQKAADLQQGAKDDAAANQARAGVDRAGAGAVDSELRRDWTRGE